jgi:AmmeMemoRadiSam system protein B
MFKILLLKNRKGVAVFILCSIIAGIGVIYAVHKNTNYQPSSFVPEVAKKPKNITALVLPHHTIASGLVDEFLRMVTFVNIKHVLIIGPNHQEVGSAAFLLADEPWGTGEEKNIPTDKKLVSSIVSGYSYARVDTPSVIHDHASYGMLPYIRRFIPDVDVTAILISRNADKALLLSFADRLSKLISRDDTLVIASVDFSHTVPEEVGRSQDTETIRMMTNRDYDGLLTKHGDQVDSPGSLIILDRLMANFGQKPFTLFTRSSSAMIAGDPTMPETVSYVLGYYKKE